MIKTLQLGDYIAKSSSKQHMTIELCKSNKLMQEKLKIKIFDKLKQPIVLSFNVQVLHNTLESLTLYRSPTKFQ
jgi:hypothetical protein